MRQIMPLNPTSTPRSTTPEGDFNQKQSKTVVIEENSGTSTILYFSLCSLLYALCSRSELLKPRLKKPQILWLIHHLQSFDFIPIRIDIRHRFCNDIHMRLGIDPSWNRQSD